MQPPSKMECINFHWTKSTQQIHFFRDNKFFIIFQFIYCSNKMKEIVWNLKFCFELCLFLKWRPTFRLFCLIFEIATNNCWTPHEQIEVDETKRCKLHRQHTELNLMSYSLLRLNFGTNICSGTWCERISDVIRIEFKAMHEQRAYMFIVYVWTCGTIYFEWKKRKTFKNTQTSVVMKRLYLICLCLNFNEHFFYVWHLK